MNWLVYHIVSGEAFFSGVALVLLAVVAATRTHPIWKRVTPLSFAIGAIAIVVSSTAIPYWWYVTATVVTLTWFASYYVTPWRRWAPLATGGVWLVAALLELPYYIMPALSPVAAPSIAIIGDSLTAGMGEKSIETWPRILARERGWQVQDISYMGATTASALKRAQAQEIHAPIVLVEIGGNDLLGSTSSAQFARDLDSLLTHLAAPQRQVIMFELPLPPFSHEFGRVQRELASKHEVKLIPKRVLLSIIAGGDATLDSIHLTQAGHQQMAECVGQLVQSAYPAGSPAAPPPASGDDVGGGDNVAR